MSIEWTRIVYPGGSYIERVRPVPIADLLRERRSLEAWIADLDDTLDPDYVASDERWISSLLDSLNRAITARRAGRLVRERFDGSGVTRFDAA